MRTQSSDPVLTVKDFRLLSITNRVPLLPSLLTLSSTKKMTEEDLVVVDRVGSDVGNGENGGMCTLSKRKS